MSWYYRDLWVPSAGRYQRMWQERQLEGHMDAVRAYRDMRAIAPHGIARMWQWTGSRWERKA